MLRNQKLNKNVKSTELKDVERYKQLIGEAIDAGISPRDILRCLNYDVYQTSIHLAGNTKDDEIQCLSALFDGMRTYLKQFDTPTQIGSKIVETEGEGLKKTYEVPLLLTQRGIILPDKPNDFNEILDVATVLDYIDQPDSIISNFLVALTGAASRNSRSIRELTTVLDQFESWADEK